ncbi:Sedoheptulose-1,7-bisphosphatase, chloroplastic [Porphyridium purpureum]|uniref:fructose-bisphosphatase n=1 Tax=Porphyridium purpureum TaxID=35688 RepID=A0A5J4YXK1_PORPP|nr:Sedoheptulose-1,7-bisphosphatase, chloroplastic [Porphyridium purpureum]|eukprot:POR4841..scf227_4
MVVAVCEVCEWNRQQECLCIFRWSTGKVRTASANLARYIAMSTTSPPRNIEEELRALQPKIGAEVCRILGALSHACAEIGDLLRTGEDGLVDAAGNANSFGDAQLRIDLLADALIFKALKQTRCVCTASSEESASEVDIGGDPDSPFSVAFDPLDGSSVIGPNFTVGTIFGVWKGDKLRGVSGKQMVAAGMAIYGPRTVLVLSAQGCEKAGVLQYELRGAAALAGWKFLGEMAAFSDTVKLFAPANLRAAASHPGYGSLIQFYMSEKYTLRYTGALVPDIYQLMYKKGGIYINPTSAVAPAKLRLLYEVLPIAFLIESAGGVAAGADGTNRIMDMEVTDVDVRTGACFGSRSEVERCASHLPASPNVE